MHVGCQIGAPVARPETLGCPGSTLWLGFASSTVSVLLVLVLVQESILFSGLFGSCPV